MSAATATARPRPALSPPGYASLAQAAGYCTLGVRTLRRHIRAGRLVAHKVGGRVMIAYRDLDALVRGETA